MAEQQRETLSFFSGYAERWREKAEGRPAKINIIRQRNGSVLRVRDKLGRVRDFLDIGCGTGELTLDMAASGADSLGVDFAPEMIELAQASARRQGSSARFRCASIFDHPADADSYDLIGALGFIEYISPEELDRLLDDCARMLRPGGALVVGSRNRLFNLASCNDYTQLERDLGTVDALLAEAILLSKSPSMAAFAAAALADGREPLPHPERHPQTAIGVSIRYQYTPGELIRLCAARGLSARTLFPINVHALPPVASEPLAPLQIAFAEAAWDAAPEEHRIIPVCSSFVLDVRK